MKTNKLCKRLLAVVLTFAVVVSMLSVISITSFAAGFDLKTKIYLAEASDVNGNNDDDSVIYRSVGDWNHSANWVIDEYSISGYVNPESTYYNDDNTEKYVFKNWKSNINYGGYGSEKGVDGTTKKQFFSFSNANDFSGDVIVDGAVYDTYYRIDVANDILSSEYVAYNDNFVLPEYDGTLPSGKIFVGWKDLNSALIYEANSEIVPTASMNFVPKFVDVVYEHCYFKDAETGLLYNVVEVDPVSGKVIAPNAPSKKGYTFEGWYDGDVTTYDAGDEIEDAADKVLVATWEAKKYEITVDVPASVDLDFHFPELDNTFAACGVEVKFTLDVQAGKKLTGLTVETDGGERYVAYKYDADTEMYSFTMPTDDVTIKATATSNKFVAYFKDADTNEVYDIKYVDPDTDDLVTASEPEKAGYTFEYWYLVPGNEFAADTLINIDPDCDYVFYAKFSVNDYDVETKAQGSAVVNVSETNPDFGEVVTFTVADSAVDEVITSITVEGKDTNGYYAYNYDEIADEYSFVMPAEDVVIKVKTDVPAYLVYFKDYEGQIYDVVNYDADKDVLHTPVAPTKKGYEFVCWDNTVNDYAEDTDIPVPNSEYNVYYAEWTPVVYDVDVTTKVTGSAYVNVSSTTAPYNSVVRFTVGDTNPNENIVGIEVLGTVDSRYVVYTYDEITEEYYFTMPAENVVIRVDTAIDEYAVNFLDYNNNYIATRVVNKGEAVGNGNMPVEPFRAGYEFVKWQICDEFGGVEFLSTTKVYSNLFVKAVYKGLDYDIFKADDCDDELEYLYVRSQNDEGYIYSDKDLTDNIVTNGVAKAGDRVYVEVAPDPTYNITGIAIREPGTDNYVAAPTLIKKYVDGNDNMCYKFAFTMPINDVEIAVYVRPNVYNVNVFEEEAPNGQFRINGVDAYSLGVAQGETALVEITPEEGYYVKEVTSYYIDEHGNVAHPDSTLNAVDDSVWYYEFTMVSNDVYVNIEYAPYDYSVNVNDTNTRHYKPVWDGNKYVTVEALEKSKTTKGLITLLAEDNTPICDWVMRETAKSCFQPINIENANVGDQIKFTVTEGIGYDLDYVMVTYDGGTKTCPLTLKNNVYYFTMPAGNVTVKAAFVEETYKVTKGTEDEQVNNGVTNITMGEVTINGLRENTVSADYKQKVTVNVQPKPGYYVKSINFTLTDDTNKDGKEVTNFSKTVKYEGSAITDAADTAHAITFVMPASDVDIQVEYANIKYSVETEVKSGAETGTITVNTPNEYDDEIEFTITPSYGYVLDNFSVVNVSTGKKIPYIAEKVNLTYGAKFTTTMPASKIKITAEFVKDAYQVTYVDSNGAYIGQEAIKFEETATLNATPVAKPAGKHFIGWTSADTKVPVTTASLTKADFVINKATTIVATYDTDATDVVYKKTTNGYVTNTKVEANKTKADDQKVSYKYGDTVSFTTVPDEGYVVYDVKVTCKAADGVGTNYVPVEKVAENSYSFVIPEIHKTAVNTVKTDDLTLTVTFCKDEYVLSRNSDFANGSVAVNGEVATETSYVYDYQGLVTITATPDKGYYVKSIVATMASPVNTTEDAARGYAYSYTGTIPANGVDGTTQSIKFPMPATNMTYKVVFEKCNYLVTSSQYAVAPGTHGLITVSNAGVAQVDDLVEVTVNPDDGYKVYNITVRDQNGNPIVVTQTSTDIFHVEKYTFTMPAENVNVHVNFESVASREYIDVRDDEWFYDAVNYVTVVGLFKGYGAEGEIFGSHDAIQRQDFVMVISRMANADLTPYIGIDSNFVDVDKDAYYAPAIAWAVDNGIITGYADGSNRFGVGDFIIRQDIVSILYRYCGFRGFETGLTYEAQIQKDYRLSFFQDLGYLSDYASDAMYWALGYGVMNGKTTYSLAPTLLASRAEVAQMIKNLYDHNIAR